MESGVYSLLCQVHPPTVLARHPKNFLMNCPNCKKKIGETINTKEYICNDCGCEWKISYKGKPQFFCQCYADGQDVLYCNESYFVCCRCGGVLVVEDDYKKK